MQSQTSGFEESMERGAKLYSKYCKLCHRKDGTGKGNRIPPLANSDFLINNRIESIRGIKYGQKGEIKVNGVIYDKEMKPIGITDKEIADVMNYVLNSWGNEGGKMVTEKEVAKVTN